ncbi:MAG: CheR family methyltransferase, partial [Desulfatirhabdiaceae bacterium]
AMLLCEHIPDIDKKDVRILATDISNRMLEKARQAVYSKATIQDIPAPYLHKYFIKILKGMSPGYRVSDNVRSIVRLANLNLMGHWPMKGPFQVIFCRNVMIYFDRKTQQDLIDRFWKLLETGGYLFVGHSEGLSGITHRFQYIKPAIYQKK